MAVPLRTADSPSYKQALTKFLSDYGVPAARIGQLARSGLDFAKVKAFNETILETVDNFRKCCDSLREIKQEALSFGDSLECWLENVVQQLQQLQAQGAAAQNQVENFLSEFDQFSPGVPICTREELVELTNITDEEDLKKAITEKRTQFADRFNNVKRECKPDVIAQQIDQQLQLRQMAQVVGLICFIFECASDLNEMDSSSTRLDECKKKLQKLYAEYLTPILDQFKRPNGEFSYREVQEHLFEARGYVRSLREEADAAIADARSRKNAWGMRTLMSGISFATSVYQLRTESVMTYASDSVKLASQVLTAAEGLQTLGCATMTWWAHLDQQAWSEFRTEVKKTEGEIDDMLKKLEDAQRGLRYPEGFEISAA